MKASILDDASLIRLIAQAKTDAFNELYDRYHRLVFSVAYKIVDNHTIAEEVALDVFVRVWQRAGTYRAERATVSTWLIAITRHHAIDNLRRQKSRLNPISLSWDEMPPQPAATQPGPEERVELALQRKRVREAVAQLSPDQQQALALAYFKGYTQQQIAEALDQPLGTIKTRIRSGMQKLRQMLQEDQPALDTSEKAAPAYPVDRDE